MLFYALAMTSTMIAVVFLSVLHVASGESYRLNRFFSKEPTGVRLFNKFSLMYLLPFIFIPFIRIRSFMLLSILFHVIMIVVMEDVLYMRGLWKKRTNVHFLVMVIFNLVFTIGLYLFYIGFLKDILDLPFPV
ncbi:hypothetical protein [Youngiibacter multivorans]|uniref:Uncharacterized protein n=1 Tax=Youngiibacter multivorans TaxID=937251 RepID=A0ABS4G2Y6_9CLOT|nr:hypothetical protein [Youngiibacter multivorans]MBP1918918.1 hypothetical protein [Youngiibacter multivorans]